MADGDLAYSHVSSDGGAPIHGYMGRLCFRWTRTYWKARMFVTVSGYPSSWGPDGPSGNFLSFVGHKDGTREFWRGMYMEYDEETGEMVPVAENWTVVDGNGPPAVAAEQFYNFSRLDGTKDWGGDAGILNIVSYGSTVKAGIGNMMYAMPDWTETGATWTGGFDADTVYWGEHGSWTPHVSVRIVWTQYPHHPLCTHAGP